MARLSLEERLNRIEDKISEKSFRENKGLGNEVGYYVFDYDPRAELEVRNHIAYLKDRINNGNKDFKIIEFDLFHTMIQVLEEEGYLEAFFDLEKDNGFFDMADSLVETLGLDETDEQNLIIVEIFSGTGCSGAARLIKAEHLAQASGHESTDLFLCQRGQSEVDTGKLVAVTRAARAREA